VFAALFAARFADLRAQGTELRREAAVLRHVFSGQTADRGALHVQADAFRHHLGVFFLQAGRGAKIAVGRATVTGFDTFCVGHRHENLSLIQWVNTFRAEIHAPPWKALSQPSNRSLRQQGVKIAITRFLCKTVLVPFDVFFTKGERYTRLVTTRSVM
jgi:hypothetical protein